MSWGLGRRKVWNAVEVGMYVSRNFHPIACIIGHVKVQIQLLVLIGSLLLFPVIRVSNQVCKRACCDENPALLPYEIDVRRACSQGTACTPCGSRSDLFDPVDKVRDLGYG